MSTNVVNQMAYLRTSRNFPEDLQQLTVEVNKTYVDIANAVNNRTVSMFPTTRPAINGESWFLSKNQRQQGFRQVYPFVGPLTVTIPHGLDIDDIQSFVRIFGTLTDGLTWFPLPWVSVLDVTAQINIFLDATNIFIVRGANAPVVTRGIVVLEWISEP